MGWNSESIDPLSMLKAVEQAADGIVVTDAQGKIQFANPAFTAMTGYSSSEVVGQFPRVLKSGLQPLAFYENLWATIRSGRVWEGNLIVCLRSRTRLTCSRGDREVTLPDRQRRRQG